MSLPPPKKYFFLNAILRWQGVTEYCSWTTDNTDYRAVILVDRLATKSPLKTFTINEDLSDINNSYINIEQTL